VIGRHPPRLGGQKLHKVTINLTQKQVERLKELRDVTDTPYVQFIRRAIDEWLLANHEPILRLHRVKPRQES